MKELSIAWNLSLVSDAILSDVPMMSLICAWSSEKWESERGEASENVGRVVVGVVEALFLETA